MSFWSNFCIFGKITEGILGGIFKVSFGEISWNTRTKLRRNLPKVIHGKVFKKSMEEFLMDSLEGFLKNFLDKSVNKSLEESWVKFLK